MGSSLTGDCLEPSVCRLEVTTAWTKDVLGHGQIDSCPGLLPLPDRSQSTGASPGWRLRGVGCGSERGLRRARVVIRAGSLGR
jgi:hypothetical protein